MIVNRYYPVLMLAASLLLASCGNVIPSAPGIATHAASLERAAGLPGLFTSGVLHIVQGASYLVFLLMLVLAVAVALPPLLVLARRRPVWFGRLRLVLAAAGGVLALAWIAMQLAPAGVDVSAWLDRDTAPMMIMAVLWALFLSALGAAQWRAWRARRAPPPARDDPPA